MLLNFIAVVSTAYNLISGPDLTYSAAETIKN
jgi:hypothetical protein